MPLPPDSIKKILAYFQIICWNFVFWTRISWGFWKSPRNFSTISQYCSKGGEISNVSPCTCTGWIQSLYQMEIFYFYMLTESYDWIFTHSYLDIISNFSAKLYVAIFWFAWEPTVQTCRIMLSHAGLIGLILGVRANTWHKGEGITHHQPRQDWCL